MTFAPGWTQEIATGTERERQDLLSYISDTYKAIYGIRPHGDTSNMTLEDLRTQAQRLEDEIIDEMEREKRHAEHVRREKAAHKAAMRYYTNLKPRNNAMEIAMRDAMDRS
jgi:hypothetical protein